MLSAIVIPLPLEQVSPQLAAFLGKLASAVRATITIGGIRRRFSMAQNEATEQLVSAPLPAIIAELGLAVA